MQIKHLRLAFVFFLTLAVCIPTRAQTAGRIESMKLLTADTGWAATRNKLFWTTDGGANWKDITPKLDHQEQQVSSVFFLDSTTGWILMHCGDNLFPSNDPLALKSDRDLRRDDTCFEFASTRDAGESWSITHPKIVDPSRHPEDGSGFSLGTFLDFVDTLHGWAILKRGTNTMFSAGVMLRTSDGGHTWTQLKDVPPIAEHFIFTNPKDGWMAGGPEYDLFVTHDGGDSWRKVQSLPDMGDSLPAFGSERRGLMPVGHSLLATDDGGRTWTQERTLNDIPEYGAIEIVGSVVIAIKRDLEKGRTEARTRLSLYEVTSRNELSSNAAEVPVSEGGGPIEISFLSEEQGWTSFSGRLFATKDGGRNWAEITPGGAPLSRQRSRLPAGKSKLVPSGTSRGGPASEPAASGASTNLGFDTQYSPCARRTHEEQPLHNIGEH